MSDEQKKPTGEHSLGKGPLPGVAKPGAAPLPGAAKPGAAPLPGAGKPGAAPLPGLGARGAGPGKQPEKPAAPKGPSPEQIRRDPFATSSTSSVDGYKGPPSLIVAGVDEKVISGGLSKPKLTQKQKLTLIGVAAGLVIIGFGGGWVVAGRMEEAVKIRDARIIQFELNKLNGVFTEVDGALTKANQDAQAKKFDKGYLKVLSEKLQGNPFNPSLFADRNYKGFEPATVEALTTYYYLWTELYAQLGIHFRATENDEPELSTTGEEFNKLLEPSYGAVFKRDAEGNGALIGDLVVVGKTTEKDGQIVAQTQYEVGTYGEEKTIYKGPAGDAEFSKNAETYVLPIEPPAEGSPLQGATLSQFVRYQNRLKELAGLITRMRDAQQKAQSAIDKIASEGAPSLLNGGVSVDKAVEEYKASAAKAAAGVAEAPAEGEAKPAE